MAARGNTGEATRVLCVCNFRKTHTSAEGPTVRTLKKTVIMAAWYGGPRGGQN